MDSLVSGKYIPHDHHYFQNKKVSLISLKLIFAIINGKEYMDLCTLQQLRYQSNQLDVQED